MNKQTIKLIKFSLDYLPWLRSWFSEQQMLDKWSGPNFRFPHNATSFAQDLRYQELNSYCLVNENNDLLAFGQFYQRLNHCHLGRLVVNPNYRGQGLAKTLIQALSFKGREKLKLNSFSLFVLADNQSAINAYQKLGFITRDYPEALPIENCLYMVLDTPDWLAVNFDFLE